MTLRHKFFAHHALILLGLLVSGAIALQGLNELRRYANFAAFAFDELKLAEAAAESFRGFEASLLSPAGPDRNLARDTLEKIDAFIANPNPAADIGATDNGYGPAVVAKRAKDQLTKMLTGPPEALVAAGKPPSPDTPYAPRPLDDVRYALRTMESQCGNLVRQTHTNSDAVVSRTMLWFTGTCGATLAAALAMGFWQYRGVTRPVLAMRGAVGEIADGKLSSRAEAQGDAEIVSLANDFNRMAEQLQGLCENLERKVAIKSRELVRSERLASVGFLAAGVAHEINNPLSIISGYAELSIKALRQPITRKTIVETERALTVVRDEAFRCKTITDRLLSLAKGGDDNRTAVSLAAIAHHVAQMITGLGKYKDRRILLHFDKTEPLDVVANEGEMKQVLLNLLVNALEATRAGDGEVRIHGRRQNGWVELDVRDNGRGMAAKTIERVFEPFFTDRNVDRVNGERGGVGLGLPITHAIIESHGGQISACSDGEGLGSCFSVKLPARSRTALAQGELR